MVAAAGMLLCGCFAPKGIIYTRIKQPLALPSNRNKRRITDKSCYVSLTRLKEPVTRFNLSVMWSNDAIREAAEKAGITEIYYADIETLSFILDSYLRRRVIFYGR
jgi:hypothetical protein